MPKKFDGLFVPVEGDWSIVEFDGLDCLQKKVGGYIELVHFNRYLTMIINEDGKALNLPLNKSATSMARNVLRQGDYIAGDVIIAGAADSEGYFRNYNPHHDLTEHRQ